MRAYAIRRVLLLIPTFVLLTILVFLSVRFIPGNGRGSKATTRPMQRSTVLMFPVGGPGYEAGDGLLTN